MRCGLIAASSRALPAPLLCCFFVPEFKVKYGFSAAADERQRAAAASLKSFARGRRRLWTSRPESIKPLQLSGTAKLARGQKAGDVIRAARCLRTRVVFDLYGPYYISLHSRNFRWPRSLKRLLVARSSLSCAANQRVSRQRIRGVATQPTTSAARGTPVRC